MVTNMCFVNQANKLHFYILEKKGSTFSFSKSYNSTFKVAY